MVIQVNDHVLRKLCTKIFRGKRAYLPLTLKMTQKDDMFIHVYTYIYRERDGEREKERERENYRAK